LLHLIDEIAEKANEHVKHCKTCSQFKIKTEAEHYKSTPLDYCTYHYYVMRGRLGGHYSISEYVKASEFHSCKTSLPSSEDMARLKLLEKS
jgi:hypothetical protein